MEMQLQVLLGRWLKIMDRDFYWKYLKTVLL